jgi:hypothetical protein
MLCERQVDITLSLFAKRDVLAVLRNADDHAGRFRSDRIHPQTAAQRIGARPQPVRERFVHDRGHQRRPIVSIGERAARKNRRPHDVEVPRAYDEEARRR